MADSLQGTRTFDDDITCAADLFVTTGNAVFGGSTPITSSTQVSVVSDSLSLYGLATFHASGFPIQFFIRGRGTQASPTAPQSGDVIGSLRGLSQLSTTPEDYGTTNRVEFIAAENQSSGNLGSFLDLYATAIGSGSAFRVMRLHEGVQVGAPTGGDKGAGTINTFADIYKNNSAYTNPDWVFERHFTGRIEEYKESYEAFGGHCNDPGEMSLEEMYDYVEENYRFPFITDNPIGVFMRADVNLVVLEQLFLYIHSLHRRINRLERLHAN